MSKIQFCIEGPDPIYEVWLTARRLNIKMSIDFVNLKKGITKTKTNVKIYLNKQAYSGKGSNDLEAFHNAAGGIKLDKLNEETVQANENFSSSDDDSAHKVVRLHEVHQQLHKPLDFSCIASLGQAQDPLYIYKCSFGDLVTYGVGKNKKSAKSKSATRMLRKLNEEVEIESVKTNMLNLDRWIDDKVSEKVREILNSNENAISLLESLDRIRFERTLKFMETSKEIGIQIYFTTECRILFAADLCINFKIGSENQVTKDGLTYLKTFSRSSKKKTSKMEAAEKMVNLIKGNGAYTNEEVTMNDQLEEYRAKNLILENDRLDKSRVTKEHQIVMIQIIRKVEEFLKGKDTYNADYDFLAELQDLEYEYSKYLKIDIKSSNQIYKLFTNVKYDPFVSCIISIYCGVVLSASEKSETEIEAKNKASYELLKKITNIKSIFF